MKSVIEIANDFVPISTVLSWTGVSVPDTEYGKSWKIVCPFGEMYHLDGATDKCMRYYQSTNSAFCFQGCGYITPVSLYAAFQGMAHTEAAEELLCKFQYQDVTDEEKWKEALRKKQQIEPAYLQDALQTFCKRVFSEWNRLQYEDAVIKAMRNCLELLSKVQSPAHAQEWLTASKKYLEAAVNGL